MATPNTNFKDVLGYIGITNLELAKALDYDPSLISRYLTGHRRLPAASPQMDAIADYILSRAKRLRDIEWLKARFAEAGLPDDVSTVYRLKQNLVMWLATDGETLRRNLGGTLPGDIGGGAPTPAPPHPPAASAEGDVKTGFLELVLSLRPTLEALPQGAVVQIFLSSDRVQTAVNEDVSALFGELARTHGLHFHMTVCVSGDTRAMSRLLDTYIAALISGHVQLSVVRGVTQPVTDMMHILIPDGPCYLVNETAGAAAPPIAAVVRDGAFIEAVARSYADAARYAQPILSVYGDEYTRHVIEILALEYCTPGGLDVVKDSVNPMYMTCEAYDRFLGTRGHAPQELAWRSAEFARFKLGMDANLQNGVPFREIIPLSRLNDIVLRGSCRMAGLYFAERGYVDLDTQGCLDILNGYLAYLQREPAFQLLIHDDLNELHGNNCWHIKREAHVSINNWQGKEPVMIYSDQLMLLREFQTRFDALWAKGAGAIGSRANVVSILKDVAARLARR